MPVSSGDMIGFKEFLDLFNALVVPAIGYGAYVLRDIRDNLRTLNGRVGKSEQWQHDHDARDIERFDSLRDDLMQLRATVSGQHPTRS
jgi:hypothetical protein